jgi:biotin carboxylase
LAVFAAGNFDVLFPTQEQVAVLSESERRLGVAGVATAVPPFEALARVQDKLAAHATLAELGLPQPDATVVASARELAAWGRLPVFVKTPIGTATTGVHHVGDPTQLAALVSTLNTEGVFADGGVLVQSPVGGPLVMIQCIFANGELVASHANLRVREGASGGASHKQSIRLPQVPEHLKRLGGRLGWHGALSADAILTENGPVYIDVNPRLVEPANAWRAGVDLVNALVEVARGRSASVQQPGRAGVATHQLLLAVLGAAQHQHTRRAVLAELVCAISRRASYHDSIEELTPLRHDLRTVIPVAAAAVATLARPTTWRWFSSGAVSSYALTPKAWRELVASRRG